MKPWDGMTCEQVLEHWDNGSVVHTIEMGGLGPGYEQAIQNTLFEVLRYMVANPANWAQIEDEWDAGGRSGTWEEYREGLEADVGPRVDYMSLTGAQWGAAVNAAAVFSHNGYDAGMNMASEDRRIMASKEFPSGSEN